MIKFLLAIIIVFAGLVFFIATAYFCIYYLIGALWSFISFNLIACLLYLIVFSFTVILFRYYILFILDFLE